MVGRSGISRLSAWRRIFQNSSSLRIVDKRPKIQIKGTSLSLSVSLSLDRTQNLSLSQWERCPGLKKGEREKKLIRIHGA
jgi:hypothetical protein